MRVTEAQEATHGFAYGAFSIALYASPFSDAAPPQDWSEVEAYAAQGADRLGGMERVEELNRYWSQLNRALRLGMISVEEHDAKVAEILPNAQRLERCLGYDLGRLLPH